MIFLGALLQKCIEPIISLEFRYLTSIFARDTYFSHFIDIFFHFKIAAILALRKNYIKI